MAMAAIQSRKEKVELRLQGKKAIVTGSSAGIGACTAELLAAEGVAVAVHGRNEERATQVAERIRRKGGTAHVVIGNLTDDAEAAHVAQSAIRQLGGVDILVNVAGELGPQGQTWASSTPALWAENYDTNVLSAVRMIQHCLPTMKAQRWGRIIQISSIAGTRPLPDAAPAYCASKLALVTLTVSLAKTLAETGITANTVLPGFVVTDMLKAYYLSTPDNENKIWEEIEPAAARAAGATVGRLGLPEDVAAMVTFLCSPFGDWITGSDIRVDGGMSGFIN
jgi:3-oxoacyl-[acyl-carrier protein] reductase